MQNDLQPRAFKALVENTLKIDFYDDKTVTRDILREKLFEGSEMGDEEKDQLIQATSDIVARAAYENWSPNTLLKKLGQARQSSSSLRLPSVAGPCAVPCSAAAPEQSAG